MSGQIRRSGGKSRSNSIADALFHQNLHIHLSGEVLLFLLFSIADVLLTFKLLSNGNHVESNPVARFFIESWGSKGMVYFKFAMVAAVFVIVQIIAYRRVETAKKLLNFAIIAVGAVVMYSVILYLRASIGRGF